MRPFDWQKWLIILLVFITAAAGSLFLQQGSKDTKIAYVPINDLPAYYLIQDKDLTTKTLVTTDINKDSLTSKDDLIGQYTLEALSADDIVVKSKVISSPAADLFDDTAAVSVLVPAEATFNGKLSSGTIVTVWSIFPTDDPGVNKTELLLRQAVVLDLQRVEEETETSGGSYIVVLAVPVDLQGEVLGVAASGSLSFTLSP